MIRYGKIRRWVYRLAGKDGVVRQRVKLQRIQVICADGSRFTSVVLPDFLLPRTRYVSKDFSRALDLPVPDYVIKRAELDKNQIIQDVRQESETNPVTLRSYQYLRSRKEAFERRFNEGRRLLAVIPDIISAIRRWFKLIADNYLLARNRRPVSPCHYSYFYLPVTVRQG